MRTHPPTRHMASRLGCRPPWPPCRRWTRRSSTPPERRVRTWQALADPDGDRDRHEHLHTNRNVTLRPRPEGGWTLTGNLAEPAGAEFNEIFSWFLEAEWHTDWTDAHHRLGETATTDDLTRTQPQRTADALLAMARAAASTPTTPSPPPSSATSDASSTTPPAPSSTSAAANASSAMHHATPSCCCRPPASGSAATVPPPGATPIIPSPGKPTAPPSHETANPSATATTNSKNTDSTSTATTTAPGTSPTPTATRSADHRLGARRV